MKYALVLNHDPISYIEPMHRLLLQASDQIDCIILVPMFTSSDLKKRFSQAMIKIYGPIYALKYLYRFLKSPFWSFCRLAAYHKTPLYQYQSVNEPAFRDLLKTRSISKILSLTTQIYHKEILNLSGVQFYNFHASLLPANKGLLPIFWAFMNNDPQGITVHQINSQIDNGPILFQQLIHGAQENSVSSITPAFI